MLQTGTLTCSLGLIVVVLKCCVYVYLTYFSDFIILGKSVEVEDGENKSLSHHVTVGNL